jgi:tetratricopeptide (TPR) repeat protein
LSLRGNETQDKILYELGRLKASIEQSIQASFHHSDGFSQALEDPSDARVAYNLQKLARAAQNFHSSASSTASTIYGANGTSFWNIQSDAAMSIRGGPNLTPNKRQQIDQFVKQQRRMTLRRQRRPPQRAPSSAAVSVVRPSTPEPIPVVSSEESQETESNMSEMADDHDEGDDEAEFQSFLLSGLEEVAKDSMLNQEFAKAQSMLEEAIQRRTGSTSEDAEFKQLQIQLAMCYFLQHRWQLAEPLIDSIAKSKANFDPVVCNLLHALAIANAVEKRFEKAIKVCKQALQGKRRLKRDFGDTSEKECNETLGLLATIHDLHGNRLDAEALRRKLSNGFSYYHPENELEFIINHPKLCPQVFGKMIALDWRRPQIPATNHGVIAELIADLPSKTFLAPIKEDETYKNNKASKKPLQTFHTKLSLYERLNTDSAKEVVGLSSASASDRDETLGAHWNDISSPSRPGMPTKRSFTRRVVRFFGTLHATSGDNQGPRPTQNAEEIYSQARPKFGKGFWSKSDGQIFKLKKSKIKLGKTGSQEVDNSSIPFLRAVGRQRQLSVQRRSSSSTAYEGPDPRPWRYGVDAWLRSSSGHPRNTESRYPGLLDGASHWVPASQILEEHEEQSRPVELADTSISRCWSVPISSVERTTPLMVPRSKTLRWRARVADDLNKDRDGNSLRPPTDNVNDFKSQDDTPVKGQNLMIMIPNFGRSPEGFSLLAHHVAEKSKAPIVESTEGTEVRSNPPVASRSSLEPTTPTKTEIIEQVLNDFKGDDTDELAVKERLERDFDEFMRKESQGEFNGQSHLKINPY